MQGVQKILLYIIALILGLFVFILFASFVASGVDAVRLTKILFIGVLFVLLLLLVVLTLRSIVITDHKGLFLGILGIITIGLLILFFNRSIQFTGSSIISFGMVNPQDNIGFWGIIAFMQVIPLKYLQRNKPWMDKVVFIIASELVILLMAWVFGGVLTESFNSLRYY